MCQEAQEMNTEYIVMVHLKGKRLVFGYLDIRRFLTHNDRR